MFSRRSLQDLSTLENSPNLGQKMSFWASQETRGSADSVAISHEQQYAELSAVCPITKLFDLLGCGWLIT
jgi:hypothetical protein